MRAFALLSTMAIRGFTGVIWGSAYLASHRQQLANDVPAFIEGVIADWESESEKHEIRSTWAAHVENRHTGQSGMQPVKFLSDSTNLNIIFLEIRLIYISSF